MEQQDIATYRCTSDAPHTVKECLQSKPKSIFCGGMSLDIRFIEFLRARLRNEMSSQFYQMMTDSHLQALPMYNQWEFRIKREFTGVNTKTVFLRIPAATTGMG